VKQFGKLMLIGLGFAIFGIVMSPVSSPGGPAVSGTVAVANFPAIQAVTGTVNAAQSGTWNVGISGTPSVNLANTQSNPVPVQTVKESAANFISVSISPEAGGTTYNEVSQDGTVSSTPFTIPSGEQFVITDVNWIAVCISSFGLTCNKSAGDAVVLILGASSGGVPTGPYMSQATYVPSGAFVIAGRSDSLKSGLVVTQLPMPSIFTSSGNGEVVLVANLRGYLAP
jgi:hypothetical protein